MGRDTKGKETGDKYNRTQLDLGIMNSRMVIHRDGIAHMHRFGHILKKVGIKHDKVVLDVGSGNRQLGLALYANRHQPKAYYSVDLRNKEPIPNFGTKCGFFTQHTVQDVTLELPKVDPDIVVNMEVIEHMSKEKGLQLLDRLKECMVEKSTLYMSTPCYDGITMSSNHEYEWRYEELKEELEKRFVLVDVFGTFMHTKNLEKDLESIISPEVIARLRTFYDTNTLSPIFAPLVPEKSRNAMWVLKLK